jgi:uncharacterized coiled-coil protein SlyX
MRNLIAFMLIGMFGIILIPTLKAAEDEKVVKLLLCYNSPKSDYCLAEHVLKLQEQISTQQAMIRNLKGEIARLESLQTENQKQIATLKTKIKMLQESIQNVKIDVTRLESHLKAKVARLERHLKSEMARLEKHFNSEMARLERHFNSEIARLEKHFNAEIARLEGIISQNQKRILALETTVKKQQGSIQDLKTEVTDLKEQQGEDQKRIQALETTVKKQTETIDTLQTTLQSALKRISLLESRLYRYTDNNDGTVTDNRTGLIWLKNANCFGRQSWRIAQKAVANLASEQCGLRDHSRAGEWRLPNRDEWEAMMDYRYRKLTLSNAIGSGQWKEGDAFFGVQFSKYWSSTLYTKNKSFAWYADIYNGNINFDNINTKRHVWAIRGEPLISK